MRLAVTGAGGMVGRHVAQAALAAGWQVTALGRQPAADLAADFLPFDLGAAPPPLAGFDALAHCAFAHVPGRYRGGEGDDPAGFLALNLDGSRRLFDAAEAAGLRLVLISSRAVYDGLPAGTPLREDARLAPTTLYGRVKLAAEAALPADGLALRATGVYGPAPPGRPHKWQGLFADFLAGRPVTPRRATEVHGADLAAAVLLLLGQRAGGAWNVSDLVLDRRDLLAEVARLTGCPHPLPEAASYPVAAMDCGRLLALGWSPGGWPRLTASLPGLLASTGSAG
jgi:nucleoside-diphosphate-sugar epimerase